MKFKHFLITGAALASAIGLTTASQAATLASGDLIRSTDPGAAGAIYYYASNGKRYVFPNEKTYKTWYSDFSTVKTVTLAELQVLPLGGNVTYKPGSRLVKITTDPKVYAVAANGTLRWVQTEAVATALYGADWNTKVDDIPDAFFINYKIGSPIASSADFSPSAVSLAATDINTDLNLTATPSTPTSTPATPTSTPATPTSTPAVEELMFTLSQMQAQAGDTVTFNASAVTKDGVTKIEIYFDGQLQKACVSTYCSGDFQVPIASSKTSYTCEARLTKLNQQVVSKTLTLPIRNDVSNLVKMTLGQAQITPNQLASVSVDADNSIDIQRIDIYVDGTVVKSCTSHSQLCSWADYLQNQTLGSIHPVKAVVTDMIGRLYTSEIQTITISNTDSPAVTVIPAKNRIYVGETVDITVSATDNDGIASMEIIKDGIVLKHCEGPAPCTVTTGPWNTAGQELIFQGRALDPLGTVGLTTSTSVTVTKP